MSRVALLTGLVALALLAAPAGAQVSFDGRVGALVPVGNERVLALGDLRGGGPLDGALLRVQPATAAVDRASAPPLPGDGSDVLALPDGGAYVAGRFGAGSPFRAVVRVRAEGTQDPAFAFERSTFLYAGALALDGNRLWVGTNGGLRAVDAATGRPAPGVDLPDEGTVTELLLHDGRLYAAGTDDDGRAGVRALDPATGAPVPGFATVPGGAGALAVAGGLLLTGDDERLRGLDPATGAERWSLPVPGDVRSIVADRGRVLVAGLDVDARGADVLALDPATGAVDPGFVTLLGTEEAVNEVEVRDGTVVAAGEAGASRALLAALDPVNGGVRARQGEAFDGPLRGVAAPAALPDRVLVVGDVGTTTTRDLTTAALLDRRTGALVGRPRGSGISAALPGPGPLLTITYDDRGVLVAPRDADLRAVRGAKARRFRGDRVFARDATRWVGVTGASASVYDVRTGRREAAFRLPLRGYVRAAVLDGTRLWVAGNFRRRRANGQRANLAIIKVDARTGRLDGRFDPHVNGEVASLLLRGDTLYATGLFTRSLGTRRRGFAAFGAGTGVLRPGFQPGIQGTNELGALQRVGVGGLLVRRQSGYRFGPFGGGGLSLPQEGSAVLVDPRTGRVRRDLGDPAPTAVTTLGDGRLLTATGSRRSVVAPR